MYSIHGLLGEVLDAIIEDLKANECVGRDVDTLIVATSRIHRGMHNTHELSLRMLDEVESEEEE